MNYSCDQCGQYVSDMQPMRRPNGDRHWLCYPCSKRAYGAVDVAEQVARDREAYAGGPRVVQPSS